MDSGNDVIRAAMWSSGEETSVAVAGSWSPGQPDASVGHCASASVEKMEDAGASSGVSSQFPWALTWCQTPLPFVCQRKACLQGKCN